MINVSCKYTKWNWDLHLRYWPSLFGQDDWILAKFFTAFFYGARRKERIFSRGKKAGNDGSILLAAHCQPIRTQDSLQLARTWIQPYDKCNSRFHLEGNRLATRTFRKKKQQQSRVFFDVIIDVYTHVDDRERARARETNFVGRKTWKFKETVRKWELLAARTERPARCKWGPVKNKREHEHRKQNIG